VLIYAERDHHGVFQHLHRACLLVEEELVLPAFSSVLVVLDFWRQVGLNQLVEEQELDPIVNVDRALDLVFVSHRELDFSVQVGSDEHSAVVVHMVP
jgi:hypothetical protein